MDENRQFSAELAVSFIIVNYRTPDLVIQCIQSIRQFCLAVPYEIIVVDNHSQDQSVAQLSQCSGIQLIKNDVNAGFAAANNRGAAVARGKYLYLLNSDTYLIHDAVSILFEYMENEAHADVAICGTDLINPDRKKQASFGNFPSIRELLFQFGFDRFFRHYYTDRLSQGVPCLFDTPKVVDFVSGASMFVRSEVYRQLKGMDEDYFLYFEETDFAWRAQLQGWKTMLLPAARVVHLEGGSQVGQTTNNFVKLANFTRGKELFFRKNKHWSTAFCARILLMLRLFLAGARRWDRRYFTLAYRLVQA